HGKSAFRDHFPHAFRGPFFEMDSHARITCLVFGQEAAKKRISRWSDVAKPEFAFFAGGGAADAAQRFFELVKQKDGFAEKDSAGGSKTDVMAGALEQKGP